MHWDRRLQPGAIDHLNWTANWNNITWTGQVPSVANHKITRVDMFAGFPNPGPDRCTYAPPPFDVTSWLLPRVPAVAFANFPIT